MTVGVKFLKVWLRRREECEFGGTTLTALVWFLFNFKVFVRGIRRWGGSIRIMNTKMINLP